MGFLKIFSLWSVILSAVAAIAAVFSLSPMPPSYIAPIGLGAFLVVGGITEAIVRVRRRNARKDA